MTTAIRDIARQVSVRIGSVSCVRSESSSLSLVGLPPLFISSDALGGGLHSTNPSWAYAEKSLTIGDMAPFFWPPIMGEPVYGIEEVPHAPMMCKPCTVEASENFNQLKR